MNIKELKINLQRKKGQQMQISKDISKAKEKKYNIEKEIVYSERAQAIIQLIARQTQEQIEINISDIVSTALSSIFDNPYEFKVEFFTKRNRPGCSLSFMRDGEQIHPLSASGGGIIDVASFALRTACWTLQQPRSRKIIILDEPFRFLSTEYITKASELLKELSVKLGLQFIIITHIKELAEAADRLINVELIKGKSKTSCDFDTDMA